MKDHRDYASVPPIGEVFEYRGQPLVAVPYGVVGSCGGCVANTLFHSKEACHALPPCADVTFIKKEDFDTEEFKVRLVVHRMGLDKDDT